jgi:hypothetical protein
MPMPTTAKWPKPKGEDEFEDMCVDALKIRWKDPHATRNGRRGQRQDGVDIVGHPPWLGGKTAGAQCKNTDALTLKDVVAEATKAKSFRGGLGEFLVFTTGERDATLQAEVREHFRNDPLPFHVEVVFWPDIVLDLSSDEALVRKHWHGFGSGPADAWPRAPQRVDREHVRDEEVVECQCELAIRTPGFMDVAGGELAAAVQALTRSRPSSAGVEIGLMVNNPPLRVHGLIRWQEHNRECGNVIRKWELEIGDGGFLAFRWSRFTNLANHREAALEVLPLLDGVIVPLRLHRLAIESAALRAGNPLPERIALRLSCYATPAPLQLRDNMGATVPRALFSSMPESAPDWTVSIEQKWERSSRGIAIRILDRGLLNFTVSTGFPGTGATTSFVKIDEVAIDRVGGADL